MQSRRIIRLGPHQFIYIWCSCIISFYVSWETTPHLRPLWEVVFLQSFHRSHRGYFVHAPSQSETTLYHNVVSHWLGACTKLSLNKVDNPLISLLSEGLCYDGLRAWDVVELWRLDWITATMIDIHYGLVCTLMNQLDHGTVALKTLSLSAMKKDSMKKYCLNLCIRNFSVHFGCIEKFMMCTFLIWNEEKKF